MTEVGDRWRFLFDNVPDAITELDPEGRVLLTNRRVPALGVDDPQGHVIYDVVPEFLREGLRSAVEEVVRTGETRAYEARLPTPNGESYWLTRFVPVRADGRVARVVAIATEITERKRAERALRESEERLRLAIHASEDGVWDWDCETGETIFSDRWAGMLGYAVTELRPHYETWRGLVHPADLARVEAALLRHLRGETDHYEEEHRLRTRSGAWRWVLTRGKVVARGSGGRALRVAGTHKDIDAEKQADAERERLIAELQSALENVKTLSGLLPICGSCKKIRDDKGYWQRIEAYVSERSDAQFSHGLCPSCADRMKAELRERYPSPGGADED
jgi:PAS domain S-box-containing protein